MERLLRFKNNNNNSNLQIKILKLDFWNKNWIRNWDLRVKAELAFKKFLISNKDIKAVIFSVLYYSLINNL